MMMFTCISSHVIATKNKIQNNFSNEEGTFLSILSLNQPPKITTFLNSHDQLALSILEPPINGIIQQIPFFYLTSLNSISNAYSCYIFQKCILLYYSVIFRIRFFRIYSFSFVEHMVFPQILIIMSNYYKCSCLCVDFSYGSN